MSLRKQRIMKHGVDNESLIPQLQALSSQEQAALQRVQLRRRLNEADEGWLAPLVDQPTFRDQVVAQPALGIAAEGEAAG